MRQEIRNRAQVEVGVVGTAPPLYAWRQRKEPVRGGLENLS